MNINQDKLFILSRKIEKALEVSRAVRRELEALQAELQALQQPPESPVPTCPKCGESNFRTYSIRSTHGRSYQTKCLTDGCWHTGPQYPTEQLAILKWREK